MRTRLNAVLAILGGALLALVATATVLGYSQQVAATVVVSGPSGAQACGTPVTISAVIQETGGALIEGQTVFWTFESGNVSGDTILTASSVTNASGVATTKVQFACSPHSVTIMAVADEASGTVVIQTSGKGLPRTDTAPGTSFPAVLLAALAVLIGTGTILRRFATARR